MGKSQSGEKKCFIEGLISRSSGEIMAFPKCNRPKDVSNSLWLIRMCRLKLFFVLYVFPHVSHAILGKSENSMLYRCRQQQICEIISPVCQGVCCLRSAFVLNFFPQISQMTDESRSMIVNMFRLIYLDELLVCSFMIGMYKDECIWESYYCLRCSLYFTLQSPFVNPFLLTRMAFHVHSKIYIATVGFSTNFALLFRLFWKKLDYGVRSS